MRILSRYFVARFLGLYLAVLSASVLAILIVEMLLNLDDMLRAGDGATGIARYLFLRVPSYYLRDLMPMAAFAAGFLTMAMAGRWQEVTALKAGGISPLRILLPLSGVAAVIAVAAGLFQETWSLNATHQFELQRSGAKHAAAFRGGSFWYHRGSLVYNIRGADRNARTLHGVSLYERNREGLLLRSIHAERVLIEDDRTWRFRNAVVRTFDPDFPSQAPRVEEELERVLEMSAGGNQALVESDATLLPLPELWRYLQAREEEEEPVPRLWARFHSRITDPLSVLLFAWIAFPIGMQVERGSLGRSAATGLLLVVGYLGLRSLSQILAAEGVTPVAPTLWFVPLAFGLLGLWRIGRVPR